MKRHEQLASDEAADHAVDLREHIERDLQALLRNDRSKTASQILQIEQQIRRDQRHDDEDRHGGEGSGQHDDDMAERLEAVEFHPRRELGRHRRKLVSHPLRQARGQRIVWIVDD